VLVRWLFRLFMGTAKLVAKGTVDKEQEKMRKKTQDMILHNVKGERYQALPDAGMPKAALLAKLRDESAQETKWRKGQVSGTVYHGGEEATEVVVEAFRAFAVSNPLHPDVFPFVRKMEAEVVQMCCAMFHGGPDTCGTMTSGGTESIIMAVKTYRDWARAERGVTEPELVRCKSAHAAFDKACHYLGVRLVEADFDPETFRMDVAHVRRLVNRNTICIAASALTYPQGVMDDIPALAALAKTARCGLHVDNCLGSLLLPFLPAAGFPLPPFDFAVPGVTSLSADTHKYGFAPKGSSVVLYASREASARPPPRGARCGWGVRAQARGVTGPGRGRGRSCGSTSTLWRQTGQAGSTRRRRSRAAARAR
jgi:sphinganine-1-phosphate aldolase